MLPNLPSYQPQKLSEFENTLNKPKVTVNLEDAVLQEQKLYQILEVSF